MTFCTRAVMRKHPELNTHMHIPLPMLSSNSVKMGPKNAIPHAHTHTHTPVIRHHSNQQKQCKKTTLIVSQILTWKPSMFEFSIFILSHSTSVSINHSFVDRFGDGQLVGVNCKVLSSFHQHLEKTDM